MTFDQMQACLDSVGIDRETQVQVIGATMRARRRVQLADYRLWWMIEGWRTAAGRRYERILKCGMRIVLRHNGVCRAELNRGRVRGGVVVAVVNH